jgi:hypothetical protein
MGLLWLEVSDREARGTIERDLISLLSNAAKEPVDPPSAGWLGRSADRAAILRSGLWNVNHVDDAPAAGGLAAFVEHVMLHLATDDAAARKYSQQAPGRTDGTVATLERKEGRGAPEADS